MTEIRITPTAQLILLLLILSGIGLIVAAQVPEIRRYLGMRSM
jgi:thiosulfate reductase cytochrome b subunit